MNARPHSRTTRSRAGCSYTRFALLYITAILVAAPAAGAPTLPSVGEFADADYEAAIAATRNAPPRHPSEFEVTGGSTVEFPGSARALINNDGDTSHYARGNTMIVNVFIDHAGGTWSPSEISTAAAKGTAARNYFVGEASAGANLNFDHEGTNLYYYYNVTITQDWPSNSGANYALMQIAIGNLGFIDADGDGSNVDDFTLYLQNSEGGWDNVICVYQPADRTGRAEALFATGSVTCYTNSDATVWRHEFGHSFGACDEYVEGGRCNGGIDCGGCQSAYLPTVVNNGNCQLPCGGSQSCIMINNVTDVCSYTWQHWGWQDADGNGMLDWLRRINSTGSKVAIMEIGTGGGWYWTGEEEQGGFSYSQRNGGWSAMGLWNPPGDDYDLFLYGDNNHNNVYANSRTSGSVVDFVVGDYNHNHLGIQHLGVDHWSGPGANYLIARSTEGLVVYPDGVARPFNAWIDDVVQVFDLPLFGGEEIVIRLENVAAGLDLGVALFKSNGDSYWTGRAGAVALQDASGAGWDETLVYTAPSDDVYGLLVWNNDPTDQGSYDLRVGPASITLAEESPVPSTLSLRLYDYEPNAAYWSFVGTRPSTADDVALRLFDDPQHQVELGVSDVSGVGGVEFFAVDYNDGAFGTEHLRTSMVLGGGIHETEWEHDSEMLVDIASHTWSLGHVGKVWDVHVEAGRTYFFRQYHDMAEDLDTGIYLFDSIGDPVKTRSEYLAASDFRPASAGGEWFSATPFTTDWHGAYVIANNYADAFYSFWMGEQLTLSEDVTATTTTNVMFTDATVTDIYWTAFGVRRASGDVSAWLYGDDGYTITTLAADEQYESPVALVVGDYNHVTTGTVYPRFEANSGATVEWEGGSELWAFYAGDDVAFEHEWPAGDVVEVFDILIDGSTPGGLTSVIAVDDLSGQMDLGIALFASHGTPFHGSRAHAERLSDQQGPGGTEFINYHATETDWYGLVIYNKNDAGGAYRIRMWEPGPVDVEEPVVAAGPVRLTARSRNPFTTRAELGFSLPAAGPVDLTIFGVDGRRVRTLVDEPVVAGSHVVHWDGRDVRGRAASAGVYVARLRAGEAERSVKLIKSR